MKILIFELKDVCYNSYTYFAEAIGSRLSALGHDVEYFRISEEPFENVEKYVGQSFDAVIDINSDLPRAFMDDDSYFLDHINGEFYDIILDHPLYHHDSLKHKLNSFNVLCLDKNHKNYISENYPNIKKVGVCHLTGETAIASSENIWNDWEKRPYDICFTGSYTAPEKMELAIHKLPDEIRHIVMDISDILLAEPDKTIEEVVTHLANDEKYDYLNNNFPIHMQTFYLADAYNRCINRKKIVETLDNEIENFHLFGGMWEELQVKHAIIHQEVPFSLSFTIQNHSKICLNVMPNFKNGCHDRVFSAQLNGAVTLTDPSLWLLNEYKDKEDILFYDLNSIEKLPELVQGALYSQDTLIKIAQAGYSKSMKDHTWANVVQNLIDFMN